MIDSDFVVFVTLVADGRSVCMWQVASDLLATCFLMLAMGAGDNICSGMLMLCGGNRGKCAGNGYFCGEVTCHCGCWRVAGVACVAGKMAIWCVIIHILFCIFRLSCFYQV